MILTILIYILVYMFGVLTGTILISLMKAASDADDIIENYKEENTNVTNK